MIKKISVLLLLLFFILLSCGKKGDPVIKESLKKYKLIASQIIKA